MVAALINLRALYWPSSLIGAALRVGKSHVQERVYPDSGYASAEEEEETLEDRLSLLRSNPLERAFAIRWLTGFIARSQEWVEAEDDHDPRQCVVEEAVALLALSADTHADGALTREFTFSTWNNGRISVELKDESYGADHESVGLQTWGSASVLAERICADPAKFLKLDGTIRILELGAGTGLLSMILGKLQSTLRNIRLEIVATDFHQAVLKNLRENVTRNFSVNVIRVETLDWAAPPLLDEVEKYDVVFAADVIYHQRHGPWIKACAEQMLRRRGTSTMWMIIPCRPTHIGELNSVGDIFAGTGTNSLTIIKNECIPRHPGIGKADEDGYRLFEIGWNC